MGPPENQQELYNNNNSRSSNSSSGGGGDYIRGEDKRSSFLSIVHMERQDLLFAILIN